MSAVKTCICCGQSSKQMFRAADCRHTFCETDAGRLDPKSTLCPVDKRPVREFIAIGDRPPVSAPKPGMSLVLIVLYLASYICATMVVLSGYERLTQTVQVCILVLSCLSVCVMFGFLKTGWA